MRNGGCPERINLIENHYTSASPLPGTALLFNDNADPAQIYSLGNRFPAEETDDGTAPSEFSRTAPAEVTLFDDAELETRMLPFVGLPTRTTEEAAVIQEIIEEL